MRNRYVLLSVMLAFCIGIVNFLSYDAHSGGDAGIKAIEKIPVRVGKWEGVEVPLEERVFEILETRSIIHRYYTSNNRRVFLSVVYYPETKVDFHAPEACLGGAGIRINKSVESVSFDAGAEKIDLDLVKLVRKNGTSRELIYYFYKAGDFLGDSYMKLRMSLVWNKILLSPKSGALIRISTRDADGGFDYSREVLLTFIRDIYPYLMKMP